MANTTIVIRSSGETGNTPSLGVIANGELSLNYADGILYYKSAANTLGQIKTTQVAGLTTEVQFNDAGAFGGSSSLTFNKVSGLLQTTNVTASSVASQTYVQFGDGSKQYSANVGSVTLTDSVSSTSTTTAAVPNSVKTAYDHASAAFAAANTASAEPNALAFAIALG